MGIPWSETEGLNATELAIVTPLLEQSLAETWENFAWPELTHTARRYQPTAGGEWYKHSGTGAWPQNSYVFHRDTNAVYWAVQDCPGSEVPGTSTKWHLLEPVDGNDVDSFDPEKSYNPGDMVSRPGFGTRLCVLANIGLPVPADSHWVTLPDWTGEFPYDPGIEAVGNAWTEEQMPMGSVLGVWDKDPLDPTATPLEYVTKPYGVRVAGDPGSAWFKWIEPVPQINGAPWDASVAYLDGDQFYHQSSSAYGTWYDVVDDMAAGADPVQDPGRAVPVLVPTRMAVFLIPRLAAAWLRYDGQVDKAGDQDRAAQLALDAAQLQVAQTQKQKGRMPVRAR